jgi:MFS family permease
VISRRVALQAASAILTIVLGVVTGKVTDLIPRPPLAVTVLLAVLGAVAATAVAVSLERTSPDAHRDTVVLRVPPGWWWTRRGIVALLIGLLVGILSGVALALVRRLPESSPSGALEVRSVTVAVIPATAEGRCPEADFTFRGTIRTNGAAGTVAFVWVQPDGVTTPRRSVALDAGTPGLLQSLRLTVTGRTPSSGRALLRVVEPVAMSSPPVSVRFLCP